MDIQVAVKNISYGFGQDSVFEAVQLTAEKTAAEIYRDEQDFQKEEYETMLADGDVSSFEEYKKEVGITDQDIDYRKPFEENRSHPQIAKQIDDLTNKYMRNVMDLPRNAVVTIDDNFLDEKGRPDEAAVRSALREKFGADVNVVKYETAEKAEKKDVLSQEAYDKVGEMIKSNDFRQFLDLRASIEKYSSNNISLIYLQKPDAKAVMGFNAWKKLDRHVDAGQKGISIWQPCKRELKTEKQVDKYIADNEWQFGKPDSAKAVKEKDSLMKEIADKGKAEVSFGFKLGTVFDVSQTIPNDPAKDNIDRIINLDKPLNKDMANYDAVVKSMKDAASLAPFSISDGASEQDALFDALCRYADALLKESPEKVAGIKSNEPMRGDAHKAETIMAAHLICKHIGISCDDKTGLKLAEVFNKDLSEDAIKIGKREMFTKAFDRACKVSDQFVKAFDKSFGYDLEAQREALKKEAEQSDDFAKQVDAVLNGTASRYNDLKVCDTPQILLDVGCEQLPMLYTQRHLRDAIKPKGNTGEAIHHHGLEAEQIKLIPNLLRNPVMIYDSLSRSDSIVVVTSETDKDKCPIVVAVKPNGSGKYDLEVIPSNFITSIHGRSNFANQVEQAVIQDKLLFWDKEKSQELFSVLRLQLSEGLNDLDSNIIIHQSRNIVNTFSEKNSQNPQKNSEKTSPESSPKKRANVERD